MEGLEQLTLTLTDIYYQQPNTRGTAKGWYFQTTHQRDGYKVARTFGPFASRSRCVMAKAHVSSIVNDIISVCQNISQHQTISAESVRHAVTLAHERR